MKKTFLLALLSTFLITAAASAYVIKLKDGSLIFARMKYTVKGDRAIITLENGTVTAMKLEHIDVEGSDKYNKENFGNVVAIDTPDERKPTAVAGPASQAPRLQDFIKDKNPRMALPAQAKSSTDGSGPSFQQVDPNLQGAFTRIFDGAGITQYRLTNFRGTTGLLVTANTEEQVFNALSAAARALSTRSALFICAPSRQRASTSPRSSSSASSGSGAATISTRPGRSC